MIIAKQTIDILHISSEIDIPSQLAIVNLADV